MHYKQMSTKEKILHVKKLVKNLNDAYEPFREFMKEQSDVRYNCTFSSDADRYVLSELKIKLADEVLNDQ